MESHGLDAVRTRTGDELVTRQQLKVEILEQLRMNNGMVRLGDLPEVLDIDIDDIRPVLDQLVVLSRETIGGAKQTSAGSRKATHASEGTEVSGPSQAIQCSLSSSVDEDTTSTLKTSLLDLGELCVEGDLLVTSRWADSLVDQIIGLLSSSSPRRNMLEQIGMAQSDQANLLIPFPYCLSIPKLAEHFGLTPMYLDELLGDRLLGQRAKEPNIPRPMRRWDTRAKLSQASVKAVNRFETILYSERFVDLCRNALRGAVLGMCLPTRLTDLLQTVYAIHGTSTKPTKTMLGLLTNVCLRELKSLAECPETRVAAIIPGSRASTSSIAPMTSETQLQSQASSVLVVPELYFLSQEREVLRLISQQDYVLFDQATSQLRILGDLRTYIKVLAERGQGALAQGVVLDGCFVTAHLCDSVTDELRALAQATEAACQAAISDQLSSTRSYRNLIFWARLSEVERLNPELVALPVKDSVWIFKHAMHRLDKQTAAQNEEPYYTFVPTVSMEEGLAGVVHSSSPTASDCEYIMSRSLVSTLDSISRFVGERIALKLVAAEQLRKTQISLAKTGISGHRHDTVSSSLDGTHACALGLYHQASALWNLARQEIATALDTEGVESKSKNTVEEFQIKLETVTGKAYGNYAAQMPAWICESLMHAENSLEKVIDEILNKSDSADLGNAESVFETLPQDVITCLFTSLFKLLFRDPSPNKSRTAEMSSLNGIEIETITLMEALSLDVFAHPVLAHLSATELLQAKHINRPILAAQSSDCRWIALVAHSLRRDASSSRGTNGTTKTFYQYLVDHGVPDPLVPRCTQQVRRGFLAGYERAKRLVHFMERVRSEVRVSPTNQENRLNFTTFSRNMATYIASLAKLRDSDAELVNSHQFSQMFDIVTQCVLDQVQSALLDAQQFITSGNRLKSLWELAKLKEVDDHAASDFIQELTYVLTRSKFESSDAPLIFTFLHLIAQMAPPQTSSTQAYEPLEAVGKLFSLLTDPSACKEANVVAYAESKAAISFDSETLVKLRASSLQLFASKATNQKHAVLSLAFELVLSRLTDTYIPLKEVEASVCLGFTREVTKKHAAHRSDVLELCDSIHQLLSSGGDLAGAELVAFKKKVIAILSSA